MGEISIRGLRKTYEDGDIVAVRDLDLDVRDGEFLVLVGPSGCGKTTTLRCIAGLEGLTDGEIRLDGSTVMDKKAQNRDMAMVFQNYALYPHMTARQNISFGLKMSTDLTEEEIRNKVEEVTDMMGISELLDQRPADLSGGQQQRVALGRAIVREPAVFLMDEPLSNLDAKLRTQMRTEVQALQNQLGITTIYVTHDQTEAMTMGDRIAIMDQGELQQVGTPLECYLNPTNQFVASFIGSPSMNFFSVTLSNERETPVLQHKEFEYAISEDIYDQIQDAGSVDDLVLGIRPEDILITDEDGPNEITGEVSVIEPLGDITYVYFTLGDDSYTASVERDVVIDEGEELNFVFPEERIHLFDSRTGNAIKNQKSVSNDREVSHSASHV